MPVMMGFTHDEVLDFSGGTRLSFLNMKIFLIFFDIYSLRFIIFFFFVFTDLYQVVNNTADILKEVFNFKLNLMGPYEGIKELSVVMFLLYIRYYFILINENFVITKNKFRRSKVYFKRKHRLNLLNDETIKKTTKSRGGCDLQNPK